MTDERDTLNFPNQTKNINKDKLRIQSVQVQALRVKLKSPHLRYALGSIFSLRLAQTGCYTDRVNIINPFRKNAF